MFDYFIVFFFGFLMYFVFRSFYKYSIPIYGRRMFKEDYFIIPTDGIVFMFIFFYYKDLWNLLFFFSGYLLGYLIKAIFSGGIRATFFRFLFSSFSFFIPLFFMALVLKIFSNSYYDFLVYVFSFFVFLFLNKFLSIFINYLFSFSWDKILSLSLEKTFRIEIYDTIMFSYFVFSYIAFLYLVKGYWLFSLFIFFSQFIFLRLLDFSNYVLGSFQNLIDVLLNLLNEYDEETYDHSQRVAVISEAIAKSLDLPLSRINSIVLASKLHDIGKIDLPYSVLRKKGKLTSTEFKIITLHPVVAAQILEDVVSEREYKAIKFHHFYPTVFNKPVDYTDIPLDARIIMIADVYDALRSRRRYKDALSHDEAIKEISKMVDKKLIDPELFKILLSVYDKYSHLYEKK